MTQRSMTHSPSVQTGAGSGTDTDSAWLPEDDGTKDPIIGLMF